MILQPEREFNAPLSSVCAIDFPDFLTTTFLQRLARMYWLCHCQVSRRMRSQERLMRLYGIDNIVFAVGGVVENGRLLLLNLVVQSPAKAH